MARSAPVRSYRQLKVWRDAISVVKSVYQLTEQFPKAEVYALTNQMRRAAVSVPSNIAEGQARDSTKEFLHHISIAMGSLAELDTQLEIAVELEFASSSLVKRMLEKTDEVGRMLRGLQKSLKSSV